MIVKEKKGGQFLDMRICDNLQLMAEIQDNTVDLIYCDILYGTGRKFKDYQDLKPKREVIEEHYIPRIKEMHRILKNTGSIYLQMGEEINHWIRCIMDDVFGYNNFMTEIIWWLNNVSGFKTQTNNWIRNNDKIIFYKKNKLVFNKLSEPLSDEYIKKTFTQKDENGLFRRRYNRKQYYNPKTSVKRISNVWDIQWLRQNSLERNGYYSQKPKALIERIIKASSNEGDLVADFYSGSFTTAEVCKDLKRNFIGCDINPNCLEKAKERGLFSFTDELDKAD